jgi:hypothetical protein
VVVVSSVVDPVVVVVGSVVVVVGSVVVVVGSVVEVEVDELSPVLSGVVVDEGSVVDEVVVLVPVESVSDSEAVPIASSPLQAKARLEVKKARERVRVVSDEVSIRVSVNSLMTDLRGVMGVVGSCRRPVGRLVLRWVPAS